MRKVIMIMQIKKVVLFFIVFFVLILCSDCVYGHAGNKIKRIEMQIEIQENGDAKITEDWYMNIFDGYVYYKFYKNVKNNEIQNLTVTDENDFTYNYSDDWNLTDEEKKDKCGVLYTNEGAAILWGIQSYGAHQYTLKYEVKNFVKNFSEYKGAKFDFIDEGNPTLTYVRISSDVCKFTKQNTQVNTLYKFQSVMFLEDGSIELETNARYLLGGESIKFNEDVPIKAKKIVKVNNKSKTSMKKQDILVASIIVVISILYLFCDTYRIIYDYKNKKKSYC